MLNQNEQFGTAASFERLISSLRETIAAFQRLSDKQEQIIAKQGLLINKQSDLIKSQKETIDRLVGEPSSLSKFVPK